MAQAVRWNHPLSYLNSDGKRHPVENSFAAVTMLLGLVAVISAWWPGLHVLGSWTGLAGILTEPGASTSRRPRVNASSRSSGSVPRRSASIWVWRTAVSCRNAATTTAREAGRETASPGLPLGRTGRCGAQ